MPHRAVLFDWMLTLADYPPPPVLLARAAASIDRTLDDDDAAALLERMRAAGDDPAVAAAMERVDCSVDEHRHAEILLLQTSGMDDELAAGYYELLGHPNTHRVYPEVAGVLEALRDRDVRVAVISDIHVDLRDHARLAGIDALIDYWTLSFEIGIQKPDPGIYLHALEGCGVDAAEALMIGDRHTADGAASLLGTDSLILPNRGRDPSLADDRLGGVVRLVG